MFVSMLFVDGRGKTACCYGKNRKKVLDKTSEWILNLHGDSALQLRFYRSNKSGRIYRPKGSSMPEFAIVVEKIEEVK